MSGVLETGLWALLVTSSVTDLVWGKLYNAINIPFVLTGIVAQLLILGTTGGVNAVLGIGVAFILFFPLYALKAFAAGDVKLLMAVGAWSGPRFVLELSVYSVVVGAVVGLGVLLYRHGVQQSLSSLLAHLKGQGKQSQRIPFAPAFLCAFLIVQIAELSQWHLF